MHMDDYTCALALYPCPDPALILSPGNHHEDARSAGKEL